MDRFVSIDIETTGRNADTCQILAFAAVVARFDSQVEEHFVRYIQHSEIKGESTALAMNANILKNMEKCEGGIWTKSHSLLHEFSSWLEKTILGNQKITVAGKNFGSFDLRFLEKLPEFERIQFHRRVLDPGNLYFNPKTDNELPDLLTCMLRADMNVETWNLHTALDDARVVAELVRRHYNPLFSNFEPDF